MQILKKITMLDALFNTFSTISTNRANKNIARETNEANLNLAKLQNDWNVDMWNKTNEYNSDAAKLQRMYDAGLNPNLMFGSGAAATANADNISSAEMANQQPYRLAAYNPLDLFSKFVQSKQLQLAERKTDAEVQKITVESEQVKASIDLIRKQVNLTDEQVEETKAKTANLLTGVESLKLTNFEQSVKNKYVDRQYQAILDESLGHVANLAKDLGVKDAQIKQLLASAKQSLSAANLLDSQNLVMKLANDVIGKVDLEAAETSAAKLLQALLDAAINVVDGATSVQKAANGFVNAGKKTLDKVASWFGG